jgi:hypothetical protein
MKSHTVAVLANNYCSAQLTWDWHIKPQICALKIVPNSSIAESSTHKSPKEQSKLSKRSKTLNCLCICEGPRSIWSRSISFPSLSQSISRNPFTKHAIVQMSLTEYKHKKSTYIRDLNSSDSLKLKLWPDHNREGDAQTSLVSKLYARVALQFLDQLLLD